MEDAAKTLLEEFRNQRLSGNRAFNEWRQKHKSVSDFSGAEFRDEFSLEGFQLRRLDLSGSQFNRTDLSRVMASSEGKAANFEQAVFDSVSAISARFEHANLTSSTFQSTLMENKQVKVTDLTEGRFDFANLNKATFDKVIGKSGNFDHVQAVDAKFRGNFAKATFSEANLTGATFDGADLRGTVFDRATLDGTRFRNVRVDTETTFQNVASIEGCAIDRYTLAYLGSDCNGLTEGNRMDMDIIDDVALLRSRFSGMWAWFHCFTQLH